MVSRQAVASILYNKARLALGLGAATTAVYSSVYTVKSGQRAVIVDRFHGTLPESVGEGTHFIIPWVQKPCILDVGARPHTLSSISSTANLEPVNLTLRVVSRPDTQHLPTIVENLENLGVEYDKILPSIANEVLESTVAQTSAILLFLFHPEYSARVRNTFVQRAKDFNILIDEVHITHFSCTDNPMVFEQKLLTSKKEQDIYLSTLVKECRVCQGKCTFSEQFHFPEPEGPMIHRYKNVRPLISHFKDDFLVNKIRLNLTQP